MKSEKQTLTSLQKLISTSHSNVAVSALPKLSKECSLILEKIQKHRLTQRIDLYRPKIDKHFSYLMKSRADENGREPSWPLSEQDFERMVEFEKYKFVQMGVKKNQRASIIFFTINHTIPMALALMRMGAKYIVLEGAQNKIFGDIIDQKIEVIFLPVRELRSLLDFVKSNHYKSSLKLVITAGERVPNFSQLKEEVATVLNALYIDSIGTRELAGFSYTCPEYDYYHFLDNYQYVEVLDPKTSLPSLKGELVITPLWRRDFPLLRHATGDIIQLEKKRCHCFTRNAWVFKGILGSTRPKNKIGANLVDINQVYYRAQSALLYQYAIDQKIWRFFKEISSLLVITQLGGVDEIFFLVNKKKFHLFLRRKQPVIDTILEMTSITPKIIPSDESVINSFMKDNIHYLDLRHTNQIKNFYKKIQ